MTAEQFAYWLQGYAELNEAPPTAEQWKVIRDQLALALNKAPPLPLVGHSFEYHGGKAVEMPGGLIAIG